jgi:hypothetical protein
MLGYVYSMKNKSRETTVVYGEREKQRQQRIFQHEESDKKRNWESYGESDED